MYFKITLAVLAAALITSSPGFAQIETGTIVGGVQDSSGGAIPKARIAIRSYSTNLVVEVESNEAGRYQSPPLKPGAYNVSVTVAGFKQSTSDVRVEVNQRVAADFELQVGDAAERIVVEAAALQLESESSTLGNMRPERAVAELPLNARNFATLIFLSPGTVPSFDRDASGLSGTTRRGVTNASINAAWPTA